MWVYTCACTSSLSKWPCIHELLSNEMISRPMALLVKCLLLHMLRCPAERTSIWEEEGPQHLWPASFSKHPLHLCHAVAGLVSPCSPAWPPHSVQWPCTHKYTHLSTHMQTCTERTLLRVFYKHTYVQLQPVNASPSTTCQPISLTINNDLSGAVKPATKIKIRLYVTAQCDCIFPGLTF